MATQNEVQKHLVKLIFFVAFLNCSWHCVRSEKIRYLSATDCDRYSLDAVYNEKYKLITENIFKDCTEFVNSVADNIAESLISIMADLPDRDVSNEQEKRIFSQFKGVKSAFSKKVKKIQYNITESWDRLTTTNFDLLYDNGNSSLPDYLNKAINMTEAYQAAKRSLDKAIESFVVLVKGTVRDGLQGISMAANDALKKAEAEKNETEEKKEENLSQEEKLMKKKEEIAEMIVKGFLGKVTIKVIKRDVDLFTKPSIEPKERDSVLDDLMFDILMIRNRIMAIIHPDLPKNKGSVDFARRSIYTYWADLASQMYEDKIKSEKSTEPGGNLYYKKLWSDENQLAETLLDLMQVY